METHGEVNGTEANVETNGDSDSDPNDCCIDQRKSSSENHGDVITSTDSFENKLAL